MSDLHEAAARGARQRSGRRRAKKWWLAMASWKLSEVSAEGVGGGGLRRRKGS